MKKLTRILLDKEVRKYFPRLKIDIDDTEMKDEFFKDPPIIVFPQYSGWIKKNGKNIPDYRGTKSTAWAMQDYISKCLGLAYHLIEHHYPTEAVLDMLPRGFASVIAEKLK
jgi:hypothetical protein